MIKVGVVAEARAMRIGLREVLNGLPGLSVVAEATRLDDLTADEADVVVVASPATFTRFKSTEAILLLSYEPDEAQELFRCAQLSTFMAWITDPGSRTIRKNWRSDDRQFYFIQFSISFIRAGPICRQSANHHSNPC